MGREFGDGEFKLVARHRGGGEACGIVDHGLGLVGLRAHRDIAGVDAPLGRALGLGDPFGEAEGGLLLGGRGLLGDVEIAAAGGAAAPLARRQHGDAKGEFGVVADIGQIARGGPHHRGLALEEILGGGAPFHDAGGMNLVLLAQIHPILQRILHALLVEEGALASCVRKLVARLDGERLQQPVAEAGGGDLHAPLGDGARGVAFRQLLREGRMFGPVGRRLLGVETRLFEQILVPVEHDGGALEGYAPDLAAGLAVGHEGGEEALQPGLVVITLHEGVDGGDRVFVDEGEHVSGELHGEGWRGAALVGGQDLDQRFLIGASIDWRHLDAGVLLVEALRIGVDELGDRAAHRHRVEERDFHRRALRQKGRDLRSRSKAGGTRDERPSIHLVMLLVSKQLQ